MSKPVKTFAHPTIKKWSVEVMEDRNGRLYPITCNNDTLWNDNPIRVDGRILYDSPERIPGYAKELTAKAYRWIDNPY